MVGKGERFAAGGSGSGNEGGGGLLSIRKQGFRTGWRHRKAPGGRRQSPVSENDEKVRRRVAGKIPGNRGRQKGSRTTSCHRTQRRNCSNTSGVCGRRCRAPTGIETTGANTGLRLYRRLDFERDALCVAGDRVKDSGFRAAEQGGAGKSSKTGTDLRHGRAGFVS